MPPRRGCGGGGIVSRFSHEPPRGGLVIRPGQAILTALPHLHVLPQAKGEYGATVGGGGATWLPRVIATAGR